MAMLMIKDELFNLAVSMSQGKKTPCENCEGGKMACATLPSGRQDQRGSSVAPLSCYHVKTPL
jgi:hypothetical protein